MKRLNKAPRWPPKIFFAGPLMHFKMATLRSSAVFRSLTVLRRQSLNQIRACSNAGKDSTELAHRQGAVPTHTGQVSYLCER